MSKRSFTDDELREAVGKSICLAEVCDKLKMYKCGSSYIVLQRHMVRLNLDTGHWVEPTKKKPISRTLDEILVENSPYMGGTSSLKNRLIQKELLRNKCYTCGLTEWMGKEISLQLDHINGDRYDNRLENLRVLCPNCHSQTPTYAGKKHKRIKQKYCGDCGSKIHHKSERCQKCANTLKNSLNTKIEWPDLEELEKMLSESNYVQVGKRLGVSDNAVRKHIQRHKGKVKQEVGT